jgi:cyclopropane-fatty-acyl-phospholipid synthase
VHGQAQGNLEEKIREDWKAALHVGIAKLFNLQSVRRAFEIGERHYDIGNHRPRANTDESKARTSRE